MPRGGGGRFIIRPELTGAPRRMSRPPPTMTEIDRSNILQDLNSRHDELLADVEALDREIERALATLRPASADPAAPTAKGR